jgi:para-nitrobenzyl esterase
MSLGLSLVLALFPSAAIPALAAAPAQPSLTAPLPIRDGVIQGAILDGGVRVYRGIPFAAPPTGERLWRPPQPVAGWSGIRSAIGFGPACPQLDMSAELLGWRPTALAEDCLYLNVWAPPPNAGERLPVMVWIHGGAFRVGTASSELYDGRAFARHGVVLVTINYRLGALGFFAHPLLVEQAMTRHEPVGNYGFLDQIAALRWVRDNVAAFGGDPDRVTIFGESGGGRSVMHHMVSPHSRGLFHRAIAMSSSLYRESRHLSEPQYGKPSMVEIGRRIAEELGCDRAADPLTALRAAPPDAVLEAGLRAFGDSDLANSYAPFVDGEVFPDNPTDLLEAGGQAPVPFIGGTTANEATLFFGGTSFDDLDAARDLVRRLYPEAAEDLLALAPFTTPEEAWWALDQISGYGTTAPMRATLLAMERIGRPGYQYVFTRVREGERGRRLGAYHGSEIRFVFDNLDDGAQKVTAADRRVAAAMNTAFARFA